MHCDRNNDNHRGRERERKRRRHIFNGFFSACLAQLQCALAAERCTKNASAPKRRRVTGKKIQCFE